MNVAATQTDLLSPADPKPVELSHAESTSPVFLLCEHAGRAVPEKLDGLGVSKDVLDSHRGWDIGAEDLARRISDLLRAPLVLQRYSRLVIDSNRPPRAAIPAVSDRVEIPGNLGLSDLERGARIREIFEPMDGAITAGLNAAPRKAVFSIHSFTPQMDGQNRPWHAGFLTRRNLPTAEALMASIARANSEMTLAINEPYQIDDASDWFIPQHAEARDLPHCLIEIRNDQIQTPEGVELWATLLADAITEFLETLP